MSDTSADRIAVWFTEHEGDGEFICPSRSAPYILIPPLANAGPVIFTTKPHVLTAAVDAARTGAEFGMIGRYGLPSEADLQWICRFVDSSPLIFLGDMDPADLMVYQWLRRRLEPVHLIYGGFGDCLLNALGMTPEAASIPCSTSEREAITFLENVTPHYRMLVGDACARLLAQGRKFELEATLTTGSSGERLVEALLAE